MGLPGVNMLRSLRRRFPRIFGPPSRRTLSGGPSPLWCGTKLGPEKAQQQLSHAKLATTEKHYLQRHTEGPDVRAVLNEYTGVRE